MTPEQQAAFLIAQAATALIEAMGMAAANHAAVVEEGMLPFAKADFDAVSVRYGIHHNAALSTLGIG